MKDSRNREKCEKQMLKHGAAPKLEFLLRVRFAFRGQLD
jgi:hypothetical protein